MNELLDVEFSTRTEDFAIVMNDYDVPIDLMPNDVHLWLCFVDEQDCSSPDQSELGMLSVEEQRRWQRLHFLHDRRRFLKTRILVRHVLAQCVRKSPIALRFQDDANGRPHLLDQAVHPDGPVEFNLSHTRGLIVLAVRRGAALGVDTEALDREVGIDLMQHVLTPAEQQMLILLSTAMLPPCFLDLWTLKESYVKARGLGLQIPLNRFSFDLYAPDELALRFAPELEDTPSRWQVWQCHPRARHAVAVCAERKVCGGEPPPLRLVTHEIKPLRRSRRMVVPITRQTLGATAQVRSV